jgi:hypothetical protein
MKATFPTFHFQILILLIFLCRTILVCVLTRMAE